MIPMLLGRGHPTLELWAGPCNSFLPFFCSLGHPPEDRCMAKASPFLCSNYARFPKQGFLICMAPPLTRLELR